jgi:hypothetical protein
VVPSLPGAGKAKAGVIEVSDNIMLDLVNRNLSPLASWVTMGALVVGSGSLSVYRDQRRLAKGLVVPPRGMSAPRSPHPAAGGVALSDRLRQRGRPMGGDRRRPRAYGSVRRVQPHGRHSRAHAPVVAGLDIDPNQLMYAIAAAVIGGTSLLGGLGPPCTPSSGGS